jgi:amidase
VTDLATLDATAQAELVASDEVSPLELVDAAIERIESLNPRLNAVIHPLFDEAREAARGDLPDGPFRGVPMLFKDIGVPLEGAPFHMGTRFLKDAGFVAPLDSYVAQRFRGAGFVIVGKTNVPELGILPSTEPVAYGATANPWDPDRSPGGSSGGSAAAVSSGMVPIAHANDGGGSIRIPASACGLVGLKSTRARVSQGPAVGDVMSGLTHEGVVSKTVRDTAATLDVLAGFVQGDPYAAPGPDGPYLDDVGSNPGVLRIGLMTEPPTEHEPHPDVVGAAEEAGKLLSALGHEVAPMDLNIVQSLGDLTEIFLTRWSAGQASLIDTLSTLVGRQATAEEFEPLTWALAERGRVTTAPQYLEAVGRHQVMTRMIAGAMETGFDLILSPTMGEPPVPLGTYDDTGADPMEAILRAGQTACFVAGINITGQPAISLPLFWNDDGLPIGIQLIAKSGREDQLIRVASQLEREAPWADRQPAAFAGASA